MIDAHCHIHDEAFDDDRGEVLERAARAGVVCMLAMGQGIEDNERVLEVAARWPQVDAALGLHPWQASSEDIATVEAQIRRHSARLVAVGEIGLDFYVARTMEDRSRQEEAFRRMLRLARELSLPVSLHSRSTGAYVREIIEEEGPPGVVFHALDARAAVAERIVNDGSALSMPPSLVRSRQKQKVVRRVGLDHLLLESDAPALAAVPGDRNEPAALALVAKEIAALLDVSLDRVRERTSANALRCFPRLRRRWCSVTDDGVG